MATMRDVFFSAVFEYARTDADVIVLTSDFSAPSFDRYRTEIPTQLINTGISEQNTMLLAAGLALEGKKVFVTSISPFITMRCFEQTRLYATDMNLDIKIVGIGAGFSYNTAGPTHHSVEDIALMRTLPHMRILSPCCNSQVEALARWCAANPGPAYVRLDRMVFDEVHPSGFVVQESDAGFSVLREAQPVNLLATGSMTHVGLAVADALEQAGTKIGVMDAYSLPLHEPRLLEALSATKHLITLEEHVKPGGLGAYICEVLADNGRPLPVKRFALDVSNGFYHGYGTREEMREACGIGGKDILAYIKERT